MDLFDSNYLRVSELENLILKYQKSYYTGEAEISDAEFDKLWDELKALDPDNPILKRVGSDLADDEQYVSLSSESSSGGNFEKAHHLIPMGSQEKAANPEAFIAWATKMTFNEFLVEYKLDGASLEMQYENGIFVKAVTRGDGTTGDDITKNVLKMKGLVKALDDKSLTGGVRGEVLMTHEVHKKLYSDKANCRNAANGLMKRKDGTGSENLLIVCYDARFIDADGSPSNNQPFKTESEKMLWLEKQGFYTSPLKKCTGVDEVIEYRSEIMEKRSSLDYDIDGLVIKNDFIDFDDANRARPEKQIAFKFSLEEAVSIIRDVEWSESGSTYTPIAIFDTVELAGTKVSRASLANPDIMRSLDVQIGSHVVVVKRGEIIPKIESVIHKISEEDKKQLKPVQIPEKCSVCGHKLIDAGTRLYCPNTECKKRILHRIEKWISVLDIRDFGTTLIQKLFSAGVINSVKDIYDLTEEKLTPFFLNEESIEKGNASKGAVKVIKAINNRKKMKLSTFIAGLDIEGIGETQMEKISGSGFDTLEKLLNASEKDIAEVYGFAEITAHDLVEGLKNLSEEISALVPEIITIEKPVSDGKLSGMTFCFTGELYTMKRSEAENLVKQNGGSAKSSVVKGLSYLVTNDTASGSSKNKKAKELGVPVIDEKQFLELIK